MDEIVRRTPVTPNTNMHREASNTKHNHDPFEDAIEEKKIIPGEWNRQREASNNQ